MDSITLTFDSKTLDYIANVLGTRPYTEVAPVLQIIAAQVKAQQNPQAISNGSGDPLPTLPQ